MNGRKSRQGDRVGSSMARVWDARHPRGFEDDLPALSTLQHLGDSRVLGGRRARNYLHDLTGDQWPRCLGRQTRGEEDPILQRPVDRRTRHAWMHRLQEPIEPHATVVLGDLERDGAFGKVGRGPRVLSSLVGCH